jgi:recA bacterial DNA recombination protein
MANTARVTLEEALRRKQLDRTLTTVAPVGVAQAWAATGVPAVDAALHGGFPQGHLSELSGPASSGRLTVALAALAQATARGELVAYIDTFDQLDVTSATAAGIALDRLLWVRGKATLSLNQPPSVVHVPALAALRTRALEQALKAFMLVLQAGGFSLVVFDLANVPMNMLRRLPASTWLRVQRVIEGREVACVLLTPEPLARSAGGLTLSLEARTTWQGDTPQGRVLTGVALEGRVRSPRQGRSGTVAVSAAVPDAPTWDVLALQARVG